MDSRQFDDLVARLASGQSRREALKGVAGGTLAAIGVTAVDLDTEAQGSKKNRKASAEQHKSGKDKGRGHGRRKKCKDKPKVQICHKGETITVSQCAVKGHRKHGDTLGPCYGYGE